MGNGDPSSNFDTLQYKKTPSLWISIAFAQIFLESSAFILMNQIALMLWETTTMTQILKCFSGVLSSI